MSKVPYKRKKEGKTDYKQRILLLKSRKLRLVIRKSLNNILEWNFKELARNEITNNDIIKEIEEQYNIKLLKSYLNYL